MSPRRADVSRRAVRWLLPTVLLAVSPKCVLCVAAYAGLGAALGLGGREICGGSANGLASTVLSVAWLGVTGAVAVCGFLASRRRLRASP